jgi:hypothetical protein
MVCPIRDEESAIVTLILGWPQKPSQRSFNRGGSNPKYQHFLTSFS